MDMNKKRKIRKENKGVREDANLKKSASINWYPGHMQKTRRKIKENINLIDVIIEVVDSRIPFSSKIKDIDDIVRSKKRILVMTKKDLCDIEVTRKWVEFYEKQGIRVLVMDLTNNKDYKELYKVVDEETKFLQTKRAEKGMITEEIRALIIGVPNAGKSTLVNKLAGKKIATTGNMPGVTKQVNWLKTSNNLLLMDTPGILWPKLDDEVIALNLASLTAIKSDVFNIVDIATYILMFLSQNYKGILESKYKISSSLDVLDMYLNIATNIGAIKGGEVDYEKVAYRIYSDLANGKISGITFDLWK